MLLNELLLHLILVSTSYYKESKKSVSNDEVLFPIMRNTFTNEPIDLRIKKLQREDTEEAIGCSERHNFDVSNQVNSFKTDMKQLCEPFDQILTDTLSVLNAIYTLLGKETINVKDYAHIRVSGEVKRQLEVFIDQFKNSQHCLLNRNLNIEGAFAHYFNTITEIDFENNTESKIKQAYDDILYNLSNARINELFYILLFSAKKSDSNYPIGIITSVLLLYPFETDHFYRILLIEIITYYKCLIMERCRYNAEERIMNIHAIKNRLYKTLCNWLFPREGDTMFREITSLVLGVYNQKKWFNELQVVLLLKSRNVNHSVAFDIIFNLLNKEEYEVGKRLKEIGDEYYEYLNMFLNIENILLDKVLPAFTF